MKAAAIEEKYQRLLAQGAEPNMVVLQIPVTYVRGRILREACRVAHLPEKITTDGEALVDGEMYALTDAWLYRVD